MSTAPSFIKPSHAQGILERKQRLHYIDVAKGMLILMVIYNHTENLAIASGVHNAVINLIPETRFFHPFFMPAFFIIAGMCSNFHKSFNVFLSSNIKALLIPAISLLFVRILVRYAFTGTFSALEWNGITSIKLAIFNLGYWNWFLTALFFTKIFFYALLHGIKPFPMRIIWAFLIHCFGVLLYSYKEDGVLSYNFYFYQHALMFIVFVEIGYDVRINNIKSLGPLANMGVFLVIYTVYLIIGRKLPYITSDPFVPIIDIIPHILMAICGSLMIIELAQKVGQNPFLELFGRHSLVIYCLHFQFMFSFYEIFREQLNTMGTYHTITALIILYMFTAIGCLYCSKFLNTKYLKWIVGKF